MLIQSYPLPYNVLVKTYLIVILTLTLIAGSIVLNNNNTAFAKKQPVNNGPAALGFRPETTHCGDLYTSATGGVNYDDGYDQGYVDAHRDGRNTVAYINNNCKMMTAIFPQMTIGFSKD